MGIMRLSIGPLTVRIEGVTLQEVPARIRLFCVGDDREADICYTFHFVESLPPLPAGWQPVLSRNDLRVFRQGTREARLASLGTPDAGYALYQERSAAEADVYFAAALKEELKMDTIFMSCLSLERHLALRGCCILHCSYLDYRGEAVLFSGPSGIGKSTHADLWCRHIEGARLINGDRALLCPGADGVYEACGWPVCGSSEVCHNERRRIRAIVFLDQAADNAVRPCSPVQLFKMLASQITVNRWNRELTARTLDSLQALMTQIPLCTYACNMDPAAAHTLREHLFG